MNAYKIISTIAVLVCVTCAQSCFANENDTGFSFDIHLGVAVYNTEEEAKPELNNEVGPAVFAKLQYTFADGNQIYIGTPFENVGEPTIGATFGNGLVDVSAFYITPVDVYKDPYLTERAETTEDGFGGKVVLNINSIKTSYELRYTEVKDDEIAKRFKVLSRDVYTHNLSLSYNFDACGLFFVEPSMNITFAMNDAKKNNSYDDEWDEYYTGANIGISLIKIFGNVIVSISANVGENQYANDDPVFNADREDEIVNITGGVTWFAPFGFKNYSAMVGGGVENTESSIDLYDKDQVYGIMAVGYHF